MGFIYKLTLKKESRKAYIGQTIRDIEERLKEHQLPYSGCKAISAAIQKHGWENFDKEWYEVPNEDLNFYEEMLVALLGTLSPGGYNLKEGGGNGNLSEETKEKIRESQIGEKNPMYGKTGEKNHRYGKTLSKKTKLKMSEAQTGENNHNSKKVYQYNLDGTYVNSFASSGEAARALGKTDGSSIRSCACGDRQIAYGFKWSREKL
ncbi:GIY-YIG catalytic domain-containing endonuclease [Paramecium bursaria Chlorella virus CVR-1]|uniref:GIY-YIG catalytic domain-containing endonuclease n=1 Tax=Paramecium bursaria Chlorella virus CVA-1 TaxID=42683 RepID=M1HK42_9PHYC|nr:GIY-YIG catalytic domain-containing endonuclease [Paramecium bursaria Chlorella virus CVA-1]AGE50534.1 GIY-YIG catalytic domain-containing endonuclease [Paramecium bursaria Chlorella virus CVA-1]AGE52213.1 GIY-YIG catalytic domain-containing endonuclease [Paramecium bursaria Chlorella virus CVR-1]